jgi:hypothetical protein
MAQNMLFCSPDLSGSISCGGYNMKRPLPSLGINSIGWLDSWPNSGSLSVGLPYMEGVGMLLGCVL